MLNLKNTLDGYLKNVEVIGNTVQDTNNLADIRSVGDKVEGQELYNISIQVDNGKGVSEVVEILSPVQLEKVGNVVDRIICKDGVWGVEKHIYTVSSDMFYVHTDKKMWYISKSKCPSWVSKNVWNQIENKIMCNYYKEVAVYSDVVNGTGIFIDHKGANPNIIIGTGDANITSLPHDLEVKYQLTHPQFIPLPHDQQIKLRTFAGQTNVAFLTEISGQIKAQVPKSLGATVNTHTEQIKDLHNSLDRVKKLEETTVSTIETESGFTTVDATSNGYFEDVKLEGKTMVNLSTVKSTSFEFKSSGPSNGQDIPLVKNINGVFTLIVDMKTNTLDRGVKVSLKTTNNSYIYPASISQGSLGKVILCYNTLKDGVMHDITHVRLYTDNSTSGRVDIDNITILEGDHTNNPPEYFEGLMSVGQDVEEVSVESVQNMLDYTKLANGATNGTTGVLSPSHNRLSLNVNDRINLHSQHIAVKCDNIFVSILGFAEKDGTPVYDSGYLTSNAINEVSLPSNIKYISVNIKNRYDSSISKEDAKSLYIYYQSNKKPLLYYNPTTEMWEKPVLREWDTIEKHSDGKYYYHKRSGEVVLNGSENWDTVSSNDMENTILFRLDGFLDSKEDNVLVCDKFQNMNVYSSDLEGAYVGGLSGLRIRANRSKLSTQDVAGFKAWLKANPTKLVYKLEQEEVYECTNIDLMTYSGETNYIINSGAISPKSLLKVHNNISNVVKILQEKVSLLENTFIAGLKSVLSGDMYSLATILYPEDFEQNDNTEQDIMVIPE